MTVPSVANREPWQGQSQVDVGGIELDSAAQMRADRRDRAELPGRVSVDGDLFAFPFDDRAFPRGRNRGTHPWLPDPALPAVARAAVGTLWCAGAPCLGPGRPGCCRTPRPGIRPAAQGVGEDQGRGGAVGQAPFPQTGDHMDVRGVRGHEAHVRAGRLRGCRPGWTSGIRAHRCRDGHG